MAIARALGEPAYYFSQRLFGSCAVTEKQRKLYRRRLCERCCREFCVRGVTGNETRTLSRIVRTCGFIRADFTNWIFSTPVCDASWRVRCNLLKKRFAFYQEKKNETKEENYSPEKRESPVLGVSFSFLFGKNGTKRDFKNYATYWPRSSNLFYAQPSNPPSSPLHPSFAQSFFLCVPLSCMFNIIRYFRLIINIKRSVVSSNSSELSPF